MQPKTPYNTKYLINNVLIKTVFTTLFSMISAKTQVCFKYFLGGTGELIAVSPTLQVSKTEVNLASSEVSVILHVSHGLVIMYLGAVRPMV